jgi:hypothetical protein
MKHLVLVVALVACSKHADTPATGSAAPSEGAVGSAEPSAAPAKPHHEDRHDPAVATPPLSLAVTIDGNAAKWEQAVFDRTQHFESTNNDGEARDTWSLRELVHGSVGPAARVTMVIGETKQTIDAAAWADATRTPIVHRTRRGALKFRWADAAGKWDDAAAVKDVTGLEISSK